MNNLEIDQFWEQVKKFDMCMLVTRDQHFLRSRPMKAYYEDDDGTIRFLTELTSPKVEEVEEYPMANLVYSDSERKDWISVTGIVRTSTEPGDIAALWTDADASWIPGGKSDAAVLIVEPDLAEYWSYPESRMHSRWEMLKGELTGQAPDLGSHAKLTL